MTIQVPGRTQPTSNPLHILNGHLGEIVDVVKSIRTIMESEGMANHHRPGVGKKADGTWGVFCLGCSAIRQDFTYPCLLDPEVEGEWPPSVLIEVPPSSESSGV